jgi:hypothetical protein
MRPVPEKAGFRCPLAFASRVTAFRQGLGETGYAEGRNVAIEFRWRENSTRRLSALAANPEDIARFGPLSRSPNVTEGKTGDTGAYPFRRGRTHGAHVGRQGG